MQITHDFYCLNCGHKGIPLPRQTNKQRKKWHRKKLYCPFCKQTVNHVECRNFYEVELFLEAFKNGEFKQEAENSILNNRCAR